MFYLSGSGILILHRMKSKVSAINTFEMENVYGLGKPSIDSNNNLSNQPIGQLSRQQRRELDRKNKKKLK
eukprot:gene18956-24766_t